MKQIIYLLSFLLFTGCASSKMVDSWKNDAYNNYQPQKVLIVGLTENLTARTIFESQLKMEFKNRGIDAVESYAVFTPSFTSVKQTEAEIQDAIKDFSKDGFDAVLISAVRGVDEKMSYSGNQFRTGYSWHRFGRYYYLYQDVYYDPGYYNKYKVFHVEASLYDLKKNDEKALVWVASYDIIDPKKIDRTVDNYINAIVKSLEQENLIN